MYHISTLRELLQNSFEKYKSNTAFILRDKAGAIYNITYEQFKADVDAFSVVLDSLGYKDKKVAIYMKNCYEWCVAYFSVAGNVGVCVPIDKEMPVSEFYNICKEADISAVITDKNGAEKITGEFEDFTNEIAIISTEELFRQGITEFSSLLKEGKALIEKGNTDILKREIFADALAVLLFTSGTTGMVKGVMLSNKNIVSDVVLTNECASVKQDDVCLSVLPLHHTYETMAELLMLYGGGAISYSRGIRYLQKDFEEIAPTLFVTVPAMLEKLHKSIKEKIDAEGKRTKVRVISKLSPLMSKDSRMKIFEDIHKFFGSRLRAIIVGAAPLRKEVAEDFICFGIPVVIGYGLTECSPIVICNSMLHPTSDSVGKPLKDTEVKLINKDENGIGEICVKGPMVMLGYYNNVQKTKEVFDGDFFRTGDLASIDKNGNYKISGRIKNVIVTRNGKNVYPEEIEYYLLKHSAIEECVVKSLDSDIIEAEIYPNEKEISAKLKKESVTKEEIAAEIKSIVRVVNASLPSYKRIRKVTIRNQEFQKTTTKKIKRDL